MTPRTLQELRSAVARVLTARGEAPDALRVTCDYYREDAVYRIAINNGRSEWIVRERPTVAEACEAAWMDLVNNLRAEVATSTAAADVAQAACDAAHRRERTARRVLDAARAVEAGE